MQTRCRRCSGTGKVFEVSLGSSGTKYDPCVECYGTGMAGPRVRRPTVRDTDSTLTPLQHEFFGVVIFLIAAGLVSLKLGVLIGLGKSMTGLPLWYYPIAIGAVAWVAYRFRETVANLTWLLVGLGLLVLVILFVLSLVF